MSSARDFIEKLEKLGFRAVPDDPSQYPLIDGDYRRTNSRGRHLVPKTVLLKKFLREVLVTRFSNEEFSVRIWRLGKEELPAPWLLVAFDSAGNPKDPEKGQKLEKLLELQHG